MQIDFRGTILDFDEVPFGQFLVYFDPDGRLSFGMKIFDSSRANRRPAILSFSTAVHPSMTPPTILEMDQLGRKDVLSLEDALFHPNPDITKLHRGVPKTEDTGAVILTSEGMFIRAWSKNSKVDVDLATGAAGVDDEGSVWIDDWSIVLRTEGKDATLCRRGKPASSTG
jgi:hypothetical protein